MTKSFSKYPLQTVKQGETVHKFSDDLSLEEENLEIDQSNDTPQVPSPLS